MHRRAAAARSRLPRIRRHHPAGPGPDRLGNRSDGPAPGLAGRRRLGKGRIRRIGPQGMEPPRQCHALFDHQGLQRDPAPARSRERTTHPDARRGERPQERSFVGGLLHERHRPRRQRPPNGNGVGRYGVRRPPSYSTTRSKWTDRRSRRPTCMPTSGSK